MSKPGQWAHRYALPLIAVAFLLFAVQQVVGQTPRPKTDPSLPTFNNPFDSQVGGIGVIEPSSETIVISPHLSGVVQAVPVRVGDSVQHNQPLFTIDDRSTRAQLTSAKAKLAVMEAARRQATNQLAFVRNLTDPGAISAEEHTRRQDAVELASAEVRQAAAEVEVLETELDKLTVRAPIAGTVLKVNVRQGEYATAGITAEPLMTLGDLQTLHVRVEVDEGQAHRLTEASQAVGSLRGQGIKQIPLKFVRFEPMVVEKRSITGNRNEKVDTRVLQIIYRFDREAIPAFVGQQMDVYIQAKPLELNYTQTQVH
jgi:HlyD family secretion protein